MHRFINLTPHPVHLQLDTGLVLEIPVSGPAPRLDYEPEPCIEWALSEGGRIPIHALHTYGPIVGLPDEVSPGDLVIVSLLVLQAAEQEVADLELNGEVGDVPDVSTRMSVLRSLVAPGTGQHDGAIRNEKGHIAAVTRLIGLR